MLGGGDPDDVKIVQGGDGAGRDAIVYQARKTSEVRARLLGHPDLISVEIAWSSGLILSTRRG